MAHDRSHDLGPGACMTRRRGLVLLVAAALTIAAASPAGAVPPVPGPDRILFGGTLGLQAREAELGRKLDVVRVYNPWTTGPTLNQAAFAPLTAGGTRTLLVSTSIDWPSWKSTAEARNRDADPNNNLPVPWCRYAPVVPGTGTGSGKTWFGAVADGDYDTVIRSWLQRVEELATGVPEMYVTFQHEPDRLSDSLAAQQYQQCVGTPAEYRAAWARFRAVADGVTPAGGTDLDAGQGGHLRWVPVFTTWGTWHTTATSTEPERALINPWTGQPKLGATGDDLTLRSSRATAWLPDPARYDWVGADVFNYSGSVAGSSSPNGVRVDDPGTPDQEEDRWRELSVLVQPVMRWATYNAALPGGGERPIVLAEYGSVPDPTRPGRRATWLANACGFLTSTASSRFLIADYFDTNQMRLATWNWIRQPDGSWKTTSLTGSDTSSVQALATAGRAARFGGTGACPAP